MKNNKKNIKRIIAAAVMMAMVFALAACGKKSTSDAFGFNNGSVVLIPGDKFYADAEGMPETTAYVEAASCFLMMAMILQHTLRRTETTFRISTFHRRVSRPTRT